MRTKSLTKVVVLLCGVFSFCCSCESWLDVRMKDKILEEELFQDIEGYMTALNGVYSELNGPDIYGRNLSMGVLDVMAQYYDVVSPQNHSFKVYGNYDYTQSACKNTQSALWAKMYSLLANVNLLLENCNREDCPLPEPYFGLITGEAYALRGMLHFDLLRLWGPTYSGETKSRECIPYMESSDRQVQPLLSAEEVMGKVIRDLTEAERLLAGVDPVIEEGPRNGSSALDVNNYLNYRQYRLNYYAVKGLLARAYLWKGDLTNAGRCASEVIEVVEGDKVWFPFVNSVDVNKERNPDRIFSTEVLFGLYNTSRVKIHNALFSDVLDGEVRLGLAGSFSSGRIRVLYPYEGDIRLSLWPKVVTEDGSEVVYFSKYMENSDPKNQYMIPLIRVSEMFLIKAECCTSLGEAQSWINKVRFARKCMDVTLTDDNREYMIREEFAREMIGEGQLFFYYKRKGLSEIPDGSKVNATREMGEGNYVWSLPDSELQNRVTNN